MTLSEIATFAGEKIGKTDSDTVTFLKKSASLNYRRVWAFAPWRETVTSSTYSVSTSKLPILRFQIPDILIPNSRFSIPDP